MIHTRAAKRWRCVLLGAVGMLVAPGLCKADDAEGPDIDFDQAVKPFIASYCAGCHGSSKPKGDRRLDQLTGQIRTDNDLVDLQDVLDQLNLGEMPPEDAKQPTDAQRRQVIQWLTRRIQAHHQSHAVHTETVLRRMNAREYRHTIRDLLHLDMQMFDPTTDFPRDQVDDHLDNVGGTLVMSGHLMAGYLAAAEQIIEKVMSTTQRPDPQQWTFHDGFRQQPEIDQVHRKTNNYEHITLYDVIGADKLEGGYGPIHGFRQGVPHDGFYEIRFKATALNRKHPYDPAMLGTDASEPLQLGIVAGTAPAGPLHKPQPIEPLLAKMNLADEPRTYTVRIWLDAGYTPRFTFRNGLMDVRNLWGRLVKRYKDQFPKLTRGGIVEHRFNAIKYGKLPQIHIDDIEIRGPLYEQWPTAGQRAVLGEDWQVIAEDENQLTDELMRMHLSRFMSRAYRRTADEEEVDRILDIIRQRRSAGRTPLAAYGDGLKAVLCSPHFLYLNEDPPKDASRDQRGLSATTLATRLSYFLWSSMPDEELLEALRGVDPGDETARRRVLRVQVRRMLADAKSEAFIEGFLGSWLTLRDLGATPPDRTMFRAYYHDALEDAMREETHRFARHLLDENLDIENFLDSDFTFVNKRLAQLYGLPWPAGVDFSEFRKAPIKDRRRGGLLGHASVLTVTANGIETSPVVRGVWILENLLGTPPNPPPPDVEPLDPDVRGAKSIRDQLRRHREVTSCNDCHRKIDPMGFALENFDPIGRWRTQYERRIPIDASGQLPSGHEFKDIVGLKEILGEQEELFTRALTTKMLAYALGRKTTPSDRPQIDQIVKDLGERGGGFRDLVEFVVVSHTFALHE